MNKNRCLVKRETQYLLESEYIFKTKQGRETIFTINKNKTPKVIVREHIK